MVTCYIMHPIEDIILDSVLYKKKKKYFYMRESDYPFSTLVYDAQENSKGYVSSTFTKEMKKYFRRVQSCSRSLYIDRNILRANMVYDSANDYILEFLFDLPSKNKMILYSREKKSVIVVPKENYIPLDEFLKRAQSNIVEHILISLGSEGIKALKNYDLSDIKVAPTNIEM